MAAPAAGGGGGGGGGAAAADKPKEEEKKEEEEEEEDEVCPAQLAFACTCACACVQARMHAGAWQDHFLALWAMADTCQNNLVSLRSLYLMADAGAACVADRCMLGVEVAKQV